MQLSTSPFFGGFHHRRPGSVAEKHAGGAVLPVHQFGKHLCSDHQSLLIDPRLNIGVGRVEGKKKSGAGRSQIESHRAICLNLLLHHTGGAGKLQIPCAGGHNNQLNLSG